MKLLSPYPRRRAPRPTIYVAVEQDDGYGAARGAARLEDGVDGLVPVTGDRLAAEDGGIHGPCELAQEGHDGVVEQFAAGPGDTCTGCPLAMWTWARWPSSLSSAMYGCPSSRSGECSRVQSIWGM